ncbi:MAG TPA: tryptophan synthase subunit alpha [Clostridia bacterium]|nr:tryptophan synthase subunit alpha [Clostridia bacterium]
MTDRIAEMFQAKKTQGKKALITFVTAGDRCLEETERLVLEMENKGADLVELGIPFSDPVAEGPVIQDANLRALKHKIRVNDVFDAVARLREKTQIPIVFLLYFNCVLNDTPERFFKRCAQTGVDGVIIPDLPIEEREEAASVARSYGIKVIPLVAPTSQDRIDKIAGEAEGFLYCVSSLGVTGMRSKFETDFESFFGSINKAAKTPTALGFGISSPEQAAKLKKYADGIIVGSAIVRLVGDSRSEDEAVEKVGGFVASLRAALDTDS